MRGTKSLFLWLRGADFYVAFSQSAKLQLQ